MQKLIDAIECAKTAKKPICGVKADLPHIHEVRQVQSNPITNVRAELLEEADIGSDHFYFVKNLEEMPSSCAQNWKLPSEMGIHLG